jgi:hypothetical protein
VNISVFLNLNRVEMVSMTLVAGAIVTNGCAERYFRAARRGRR